MMNKTKLAVGITAALAMAALAFAPQAEAHKSSKKHSHSRSKSITTHATTYTSTTTMTAMNNSRVEALEAQVQAMQYELQRLRAQASRPAMNDDSAKVQELEQWMNTVKAKPESKDKNDSMVFFRGGFAYNDQVRNDLLTGNQFASNYLGAGDGVTNQQGWYTGAGFDFSLTDDVWGMLDSTEVMAELMFEYKNFGKKKFSGANLGAPLHTNLYQNVNNPACTLINLAANGGVTGPANGGVDGKGGVVDAVSGGASCDGVTVTQFTVSAAPKIKFMKGSDFRPWIIPVGLAIHVISPPSNGVTVLNPGAMFAAGAEYRIWKEIKVGMDARYHWTGYDADGVNTNGMTAGGYLGIGF